MVFSLMLLLNPSYEEAGDRPGAAKHWRLTSRTARIAIAGFGVPEEAWEDFERWSARFTSLDDVQVVLAVFDAASAREGHEDFGEGWDNDGYLFEHSPARLVAFPFGGVLDVETWEEAEWLSSWEVVPAAGGVFGGEPRETFEDWTSPASFTTEAATFTPDGPETFAGSWPHTETI